MIEEVQRFSDLPLEEQECEFHQEVICSVEHCLEFANMLHRKRGGTNIMIAMLEAIKSVHLTLDDLEEAN